jgi:hypothetical protein
MEKTLFFVGILSIMILVPFIVDAVTLDNPLKCSSDDNCLLEIIQKITELLQIIAGIQYMTSAGSEDKTKKAKQMIVYTLIGVAIITAANFIIGLIQEILGKINN